MPSRIGTIGDIRRYPVKSFAGEQLEACDIEPYGLRGDRQYAFHDGGGTGWDSFITARDIPAMLGYKAQLGEDEAGGLLVTAPDGRRFGWEEALAQEMQRHTKRSVSMVSGQSAALAVPELMAVDQGSMLLITDADLRRLEAGWGKRLDRRRFRANVMIVLDDDSIDAQMWIGRRLTVGSAELHVDMSCERCSVITLDPDTLERDASLLRRVHETMELAFGVYASVVNPGRVQLGDAVYIGDAPVTR